MSTHTQPKVLIVAAGALGEPTGTGITLEALFGGWAPDDLAQIHLQEQVENPMGIRMHRLQPSSTPLDTAARALLSRGGSIHRPTAGEIAAVPSRGTSGRRQWRRDGRALLDLTPLRLPADARRFIRDFDPDVVYSLMGSVRMIKLASKVAKFADAPLVPHFMDDWVHTLNSSGELFGVAEHSLTKNLRRAIDLAPVCFCISSQMASEYSREFRVPCETFMAPTRVPTDIRDRDRTDFVEYVYVGGLHLGRWESLIDVAHALQGCGVASRLNVFAPQSSLANLVVPPGIPLIIGGSVPADGVLETLQRSDVVVHVESFDEALSAYTRLSASTKIPQYMASGRPILAYGPQTLASMQLVDASDAGLVAFDLTGLKSAVFRLTSDPGLRSALGAAGHTFALQNFEIRAVQQELMGSIARAASNP